MNTTNEYVLVAMATATREHSARARQALGWLWLGILVSVAIGPYIISQNLVLGGRYDPAVAYFGLLPAVDEVNDTLFRRFSERDDLREVSHILFLRIVSYYTYVVLAPIIVVLSIFSYRNTGHIADPPPPRKPHRWFAAAIVSGGVAALGPFYLFARSTPFNPYGETVAGLWWVSYPAGLVTTLFMIPAFFISVRQLHLRR